MADKYMEIDFMILWKQKIQDKTRMLEKVQGMIKACFPDSTEKTIHYKENKDNIHALNYDIVCNHDEVVYLKIKCNYSPLKSAQILSDVRDKIYRGKHRSCFLIICTYDDASQYFCCSLVKPLGVFERRIRQLVYITVVKAELYDWVDKTIPKSLIDNIKDEMGKNKNNNHDDKIFENALEYFNYSNLLDYLFTERRNLDVDDLLDIKLSDTELNRLSKDDIVSLIRQTRKESVWDRFFSNNKSLNITRESINELREYRNDIAHHHTISQDRYKNAQKSLRKINRQLIEAISLIEEKQYTQQDKLYVYARFFASILNAVKNIRVAIEPLQKSMSEYSKRMEEYKKTIVDVSAYDQLVAVGNNFAHAAADLNKSLNMEGISKQFIDISKY